MCVTPSRAEILSATPDHKTGGRLPPKARKYSRATGWLSKAIRLFYFPAVNLQPTVLTIGRRVVSVWHMDSLHAPWRIQYILAPKPALSETSLFAQIANSSDDRANYVVVRERTCYAVLNAYPYNGGHLLAVPYKQTPDLDDLTEGELCDLMKLTRRCQRVLTKVMKPDGFNIGMNLGKVAGAGIVEHLHIHIVPRWAGDTNFMPVISNTNVLPQALDELAATLRAAFAQEL
jgi:ATP adenylyltransferase